MIKKILITDPVDESCIKILRDSGLNVEYEIKLSPKALEEKVKTANALIVRSSTQVTKQLIEEMQQMELIGRAGTGVDNIDVPSATRKGILVMNTPGGNTISAAEHTVAIMLSMCRNIPQSNHSILSGKWDRKKYQGSELAGKTLGLIGFGKIGKEVANRAKSFGMDIIAFDPVVSQESAGEAGVKLVALEKVFSYSDLISLHTPFNEKTKHLISHSTLAKCKDGVKIINCARGGLIDESALLQSLESGKVSAAGLDVYENEPPDFSNQLFKHPKVVCTPHLGASTDEAQKKVSVQIAEQIVNYFKNNSAPAAVNAVSFKDGFSDTLKPWLIISETMGRLQGQLLKNRLSKININFYGDDLNESSTILSTALLKGLLSEKLVDPVNLINAPLLAEEMGIIVNQTKSGESQNYKNLLSVSVESENEQWNIAGTVFGINEIRIVSVNSFHVEFKPEGNILIYKNLDQPGMLSSVSSILSKAKINIAGLSLGRFEPGKDALTIIMVDSALGKELVSEVGNLSGVKDIYTVHI